MSNPVITIPGPILWQISKLSIDKKNPNVMTKGKLEALKKNIRKFGFIIPIITNAKGVIADGEHRYKAARSLGMKEVPVIALPVNEVNRRILRQVLNKLRGEHEKDKDVDEFRFLMEHDSLGLLADLMDAKENDFLTFIDDSNEVVPDEFNVKKHLQKPKYKIQLGELWQLGDHRIMCGDATSLDDFRKLMNGNVADMVITSPPYNRGNNTLGSNKNMVKSKYKNDLDKRSSDQWLDLITKSLKVCTVGSRYQFYNIQHLAGNKIPLIDFLYMNKNKFVDTIIWNKQYGPPAMAKKVLNSAFEYIFIFSTENNPSKAINLKTFRGTIQNVWGQQGKPINKFSNVHAATFPIALPTFLIKSFCPRKGLVIDNFAGTGATLIAAEQLQKSSYMMEIEPSYCSVIIERWEQFTGKEAMRL